MAREFVFRIGTGIAFRGANVSLAKSTIFSLQQTPPSEFTDIRSYLGTPVFDRVVISGGQFFELEDINQTNPIPYDGLTFHTVLLEVTQSKNIITTALQGRNGTVKEFVSDGDFAITMTGGIIGEVDLVGNIQNIGNAYPEVDVKKLIEIVKVPDPITITSEFLQLFGINEVVVTDYSIPQKEATRNFQPFQVSMLSDVPIELNELEV